MVANISTFYTFFFPDDFNPTYGFDPTSNAYYIYTMNDTIFAVENAVEAVRVYCFFVTLLIISSFMIYPVNPLTFIGLACITIQNLLLLE